MKRKISIILLFLIFFIFQKTFSFAKNIERVIIVSIDSLNSDYIFNYKINKDFYLTPNIGEIIKSGCVFKNASAVMPTSTQINHITMLCGCYADKIGIPGNQFYDKKNHKFRFPYKEKELIKADTIMKSLKRENKNFISAIIAGKNYVGCPIWADYTIGPSCISSKMKQEFPEIHKFPTMFALDSPDNWVMNNALTFLKKIDPKIMLLHLPFVDTAQHRFGHASSQSWAAVAFADYQIGRLIKYLKEKDRLKNTLLIITSDHAQQNVFEFVDLKKILKKEGIKVKGYFPDGDIANIFLKDKRDIDKAVKVLKKLDYIDGVWTEKNIDEIHMRTPFTGDIVVSSRKPYQVVPYTYGIDLGGHGGLQEQDVLLVFSGPNIKRGEIIDTPASLVDIVPTICSLTGWKMPKDVQGKVLSVKDENYKETPDISYHLKEYSKSRFSYIATFLFIIAVMLFVSIFCNRQALKLLLFKFDSSLDAAGLNIPLATVVCLSLIITANIFTMNCNLYSIPGIQGDSFLTSMRFNLWGSSIVQVPYIYLILTFGIWIGVLIIALLGKIYANGDIKKIMFTLPYASIYFILFLILFEIGQLAISLPYNITFELFSLFFWTGFILSCVLSIIIFKNICKTKILTSFVIIFPIALLTALEFLFTILYVVFPGYIVSPTGFYNFLFRIAF